MKNMLQDTADTTYTRVLRTIDDILESGKGELDHEELDRLDHCWTILCRINKIVYEKNNKQMLNEGVEKSSSPNNDKYK